MISRPKEDGKVKVALYYAPSHVTGSPPSSGLSGSLLLSLLLSLSLSFCWKDHRMEAFTFAVSTQVDFPIHVKMYVPLELYRRPLQLTGPTVVH